MDLSRQTWLTCLFLVAAVALYAYGVASAGCIPFELEAVALPLDFMVGIPAAFYLMVVRPRRLSLLCVIPVIWVGYALSVIALGSPDAGVLPLLLAALVPVELGIAAREMLCMVRTFKGAKAQSADPFVWLSATTRYLVRKETPARMMAAELGVWYYALLSWRKKPCVAAGERAFSYHNAGGYLNMMLGLALAFPVEIVAVHLFLAQWSVMAATVVTVLSVYTVIWLAGDARARVLRPVVLGSGKLRIECGIQVEAVVPISDIAGVSSCEPQGLDGADKLNYGTFYRANVWVIFERPPEVRTLMGTKRVRAIGLSLDDSRAFMDALSNAAGCDRG